VSRAYDQFASRPALRFNGDELTYAELGAAARLAAARLEAYGVTFGDRVVLVSRNTIEFVVAEHAIFLLGAVRVALSNRLHPKEILDICRDCGATAILVERDLLLAFDSSGGTGSARLLDLAEVCDPTSGPDDGLARADPRPPISAADDIVALLYTSGTTGRPKGAMLTNRNWVAMVRNSMAELPSIDENDVLLHIAPLSHLSGYLALTCTARGACHVIVDKFDPSQALELIDHHAVTIVALVPTMVNAMAVAAAKCTVNLSSLRIVLYGGSSIPVSQLSRAIEVFGDTLVQFYGLSEAPMPIASLSRRAHRFDSSTPPRRISSAGRVSPFVELRLLDESGEDVPRGESGQIVVRGDNVMAGYWGQAEQSRLVLDEGGWFFTGDIGQFDHDGYLYVIDRLKDIIISGGFNVYPTEIENAIASLEGVREVVVVGVPDDHWGERITAAVVVRHGYALEPDDVIAACESRLASYKKPRDVIIVDELPRTASGKLLRRAVRDLMLEAARHDG
jgi:acyl-CoA synthetase (AMP-forming)/AMP-acid ligase II